MIVWEIAECGGPEVFRRGERPKPEVTAGHLLIEVAATSVNPVDTKNRQSFRPTTPELPAVLHGDVAGTVVAVGEGVTDFAPGDQVYACAGGLRGLDGALAEFMLADAALVAPKPRNLSLAEAAALPLVSITAWEGLFDRARLEAGERVLVHGGAGGVGHVVMQLAKIAGARVAATVSSAEKATIAREFGADEVIDYRRQEVDDYVAALTDGRGFDVVFDTVGGENLKSSLQAARINGRVVSILTRHVEDLTPMHDKGLSLHAVFMLLPMLTGVGRAHHGEILRRVAEHVDAGRLRPLIDPSRFSFDEIGEAHRHLEAGQAVGKVVVSRT